MHLHPQVASKPPSTSRHALGKDPVYLTRYNAPLAGVTPTADTLPFDQDDGTCDTGWCFT